MSRHPFFILRCHCKAQKKKCLRYANTSFGPSVEIRTRGLLNPIQARYQTSPHPDIHFALKYNNTLRSKIQHFKAINYHVII